MTKKQPMTGNNLLFSLILLLPGGILAQERLPQSPLPREENSLVIDLPRFPGCEEETTKQAKRSCADQRLIAFFYEHFQYPESALAKAITGVVRASFTVKVDGSVTEIKILQDIGAGCGTAVSEALEAMPRSGIRFTPAKFWRSVKNITFYLEVKFNKGSVKIGA